jgi:hypothetical protein
MAGSAGRCGEASYLRAKAPPTPTTLASDTSSRLTRSATPASRLLASLVLTQELIRCPSDNLVDRSLPLAVYVLKTAYGRSLFDTAWDLPR